MMAGCERCSDLLRKFLPVSRRCRIAKSISSELYEALLELFDVMSLESITVESSLEISCESFAKDVMRMVDELKSSLDIVQFWHVNYELATNVFAVIQDVLHSDFEIMEESSETDEFVESSDDEDLSSYESGTDSDDGSSNGDSAEFLSDVSYDSNN